MSSLPGCRNVKANIQINPVVNFNALQASNVLQTTPGYDVLGLAKYCDTYLKAPDLPAVSTLLNTFGDPLPCLKKKLEQGTLTTVQVDLMDATCWRNKVCPPGTPSLTDWKVLKARADRVAKLANQFPTVNWWLSPWLEHDIKDESLVRKACGIIESSCLICKCINSPFSGAVPANIPVERHGTKVKAFSVSGDGSSSFDADNIVNDDNNFQHRISGSYSTFVWFNEMNGRVTGEDGFIPPNKRTCWPTNDLMTQAYLVMQEPENESTFPLACKTGRNVKSGEGEIWKTNSEAYSPCPHSDKRGNRPLFISKLRDSRLSLINKMGKEVGCLKYYGPYSSPGLYRHYVGTCSGETPAGLYKEAKGEALYIRRTNGECIRVNSVRRLGSYR